MVRGDLAAAGGTAAGADVQNVHLHASLAPELIDLGMKCHIHHIALLDGCGFRIGGKIDGIDRGAATSQAQAHMLAAADHLNAVHDQLFHHQHRLGAARTS